MHLDPDEFAAFCAKQSLVHETACRQAYVNEAALRLVRGAAPRQLLVVVRGADAGAGEGFRLTQVGASSVMAATSPAAIQSRRRILSASSPSSPGSNNVLTGGGIATAHLPELSFGRVWLC